LSRFRADAWSLFIFYSSAYTGSQQVEQALSLGANAFLKKPRTPDLFWEEVSRVAGPARPAAAGRGNRAAPAPDSGKVSGEAVAETSEGRVRELTEENENLRKENRELTEQVADKTAQLEAVTRELEDFSYAVSHDLRAPLRHIDGFSQALADDHGASLDMMGKQYLDRIRMSTKRLIEMMDGLLELSRAGRGEMVTEEVDLSALAHGIAADLAHAAPERKVTFQIADGMTVTGDPRLLKVVLKHLLENAWKFSAPTADALIEFYRTDWDGRPAFAIRDNGVGFEATYTDKLFSPFQRLHAQQEFPGVGIGLAMAKKIISRHGGMIRAESELGKGATVTFTL
jgi:signal transduction histidine kinase